MTTINAGGGDYQGLPTRPVQYRSAPRPTGLDWAALDANYVARGGVIDPSVWPKVGKVVIQGKKHGSRNAMHTIADTRGEDFDEADL